MNVSSIMSRDVVSCSPRDTLNDAARRMWERDCGCIPVIDGGGAVVGMLTDRDACMAAYMRGGRLVDIQVGDVMSREVKSCRPGDSLGSVEQAMRDHQVRRMPVIDGRELVGIVSINDLALAAQNGNGAKGIPTTDEIASVLAAVSKHRPPAPSTN